MFDGDIEIPQQYLDAQAELDKLDNKRVKLDFETHVLESQLRIKRAIDEALGVSGTSSSSSNPPKPTQETPSTLNFLVDQRIWFF